MILVSFDASHNLRPLVHDHLTNSGFADMGQRLANGVMTLMFESAAFDVYDELEEVNEHEEGVVLEDGEYAFVRTDLQSMAFDRDPAYALTFSFTPHSEDDEEVEIEDEDEDEEVATVQDQDSNGLNPELKDNLRDLLRFLEDDEE